LDEEGMENKVLFLEAGGLQCSVDPSLPMPIRGLREKAYRTAKVVYDNDFMKSEWTGFLPDGHVALRNVLFAPLVIDGKAVGLLGLANKADDFTQNDARIALRFGELAAIALRNSQLSDERRRAEKEKDELIAELKKTLAEVKTLRGIVPICAYCKQVRDDKGYWNQVEAYMSQHTEAKFSHGVCPECYKKLIKELESEM